ncbi:hypothetical protein QYF61_001142 [Mycteria americana]|uniref:Uncharacterized protein n=1 Tax=Mycteria americana TaxID=33587 RepID=A0AAN7MIF5_MYCAM|nr:hypothetical protein QYF61_001142 [Mycteria americana]
MGRQVFSHLQESRAPSRLTVNKQFKNIIQRSAPRPDSYECQGVWDSMGKSPRYWAPPVFWNFTPEQVQNPEKLVEYLEKVCCHLANSRETQIPAMCWGLAPAYRALFNSIQNPQGEKKVSGPDDKATGTAATTASHGRSATGTLAPPATGAMATPTPPGIRRHGYSNPSDRYCGYSNPRVVVCSPCSLHKQ